MVDVECMKHLEPTGVENGAVSELLDLVGLYQGLPLDEDLPEFLEEACEDVLKAIGRLKGRDAKDETAIREAARLAARRAAQRWSGKKPQVRVVMPGAAA